MKGNLKLSRKIYLVPLRAPSVNVIGLITSEDTPLIQFIGSKQKYLIQWR
ncbi:hypothetical protein HMPREF9243_0228 [Aerococcus sp. Group 1]|nr:hypothetical protein HMPREF9243_0228 [Aerococcus sp. Group 1]